MSKKLMSATIMENPNLSYSSHPWVSSQFHSPPIGGEAGSSEEDPYSVTVIIHNKYAPQITPKSPVAVYQNKCTLAKWTIHIFQEQLDTRLELPYLEDPKAHCSPCWNGAMQESDNQQGSSPSPSHSRFSESVDPTCSYFPGFWVGNRDECTLTLVSWPEE